MNTLSYWELRDDAFISFRYAENLSRGLGLVFNEGERVEGYTNFLWVVLLAGARSLGAQIPPFARIFGAACGLAILPILYWAGRRCYSLDRWVALLPCCIVAASASIAAWAGAGLETALYATLFTWALALTFLDLRDDPAVPSSGLVFALAALTRPEAAGLFIVCLSYAVLFRQGSRRAILRMAILFCLLFVPHLVFRMLYYGNPLPNTFYAKTGASMAAVQAGLVYLGGFLIAHGPWALPALAGLLLDSSRWSRGRALMPAAVLGAAASYIVVVGGDFYSYWRFCVPYLPWLSLLLCAGAWNVGARLQDRFAAPSSRRRVAPALAVLLIAVSVAVPAKLTADSRYRDRFDRARVGHRLLASYGRWFRDNKAPETVLAISTIGRVPYYSGLRTIDMLGITDAHIAHRKMDLVVGAVGHQRHDSDYVLSRRPDIVALELSQQLEEFDPRTDLRTDLIFRILQERRRNWWPAPEDLIARREFRLNYAPRTAEVEPGWFFVYFERTRALLDLAARVPDDSPEPTAHFELAMLYRRHGLLEDAIASMRRAVSLDPTALVPRLDVAYFLLEDRRFGEALAEFHRLEELAPEDARIQFGIAECLQELARYAEAKQHWQRYLELAPRSRFAARAREMLRRAESHAAE